MDPNNVSSDGEGYPCETDEQGGAEPEHQNHQPLPSTITPMHPQVADEGMPTSSQCYEGVPTQHQQLDDGERWQQCPSSPAPATVGLDQSGQSIVYLQPNKQQVFWQAAPKATQGCNEGDPQSEYPLSGQLQYTAIATSPRAVILIDPAGLPLLTEAGQEQYVMVSGREAMVIVQSQPARSYIEHTVLAVVVTCCCGLLCGLLALSLSSESSHLILKITYICN